MGKLTFLKAVKENLLLPGEGLAEMKPLLKELTDEDRIDLHKMMQEQGINVEPPRISPAS